MLLEPFVEKAVEKLDPKKSDDVAPRLCGTLRILISLADTISDGKQQMAYAIVAGDDAGVLTDDQIELVKWPGLQLSPSRRAARSSSPEFGLMTRTA